jgi:hypothetical protein
MVTRSDLSSNAETGNRLNLNFNTVGSLRARLQAGEATDLAILSNPRSPRLDKIGLFLCRAASPISAAPSPAWW